MRYILIFICLFQALPATSQESNQSQIVKGIVQNTKKAGIAGANVFIDGSYDGATTDRNGHFSFSSAQTDSVLLQVTAMGFEAKSIWLQIPLSESLVFTLIEDQHIIPEVVVKAGEFRIGNQANAALSALDIVSTAGSMGNIIAALQTLPGAQVAGENGRLMVRGGDPHETQTYINGIRVGQPYTISGNNLPVRGRFSPMLFQGTNFSTGAYSAEFGNALSSILNLNTSPEPEDAKTDLSISALGLAAGHTSRMGKTSVSVNTNYISLKPFTKLFKQNIDWTQPYEQWSGEAVIRRRSEKHALNVYASFAGERVGFRDYQADFARDVETHVRSHNLYTNASYTRYLANNWKWDLGIGAGYMQRTATLDTLQIPNKTKDLHIKNKWSKSVNNSFRYFFGLDYFYQNYQEKVSFGSITTPAYGFTNQIAAGFGELSYRIFPKWHLDAGMRYTLNTQAVSFLEPRAALSFQLDKQQTASLSYGIFHQQPTEDIQKFQPDLPWQMANHLILQYSYATAGKQLRLELFRKSYAQLVRFERGDPNFARPYHTDGDGSVNGLDVFWRDNRSVRNLQYWISYSWTHARKWERDYAFAVQPPYVAEHYGSLVAKYWISSLRSQVGITNTISSGRPYHDPNQAGYVQEFTKPINTLSMNWSYLITQQKIIHISVSNVLGNEPVYSYQYAQNRNAAGVFDRQAMTPTAKRFVFVGFFWTISRNKKDNQLDNL
ncbi:TonB-dependent receptor [Sphingobacterium corticibacter]|uniref:TonB-dependent receptor n=1 Tax=Sphingobacterium corticibacter TaxID=2171749 RepID=A0A2T8HJK9_9SPHI|nr:carboxypeptidase-like regulatory domain-containing protein [Sphingobacterium corticibacter]PVH25629.1 TonB-dependent receptor [Sphingobacterium corticibacter]